MPSPLGECPISLFSVFNCKSYEFIAEKRLNLTFIEDICKINSSEFRFCNSLMLLYVFGLIEPSRKLLAQRLNRLALSFSLTIIFQTYVLVNTISEHLFEFVLFI